MKSVLWSLIARIHARQNPHSLYIAGAGVLFSGTLVIDLVQQRPGLLTWVLWVLLAFCLGLSAAALLFGRIFPPSLGLSAVVVFTLASIYFLSIEGDVQSAASSAQELPILALYLGWFVARPLGRILMFVIIVMLIVVLFFNPIFAVDGVLGVATAVQMTVIALLCFEVGSMLWRSTERRITTDQLTGALNRAGFLSGLDRALARAARGYTPLSLVVIDFDDFKLLNDSQGHAAGDTALIETVKSWRQQLRTSDVIGRTGGDEFALFLTNDEEEAAAVMQRLRRNAEYPWSWGIAAARPDDDSETLFDRADEALYEQKRKRG